MTDQHADKHYGKFRGIVVDNSDPNNQGRVRARVPAVLQDVPTGWAYPSAPYGGPGSGVWTVPPVGAGVWIEFEAGDVANPIWTGCWWAADQRPSDNGGAKAAPTLKIIRSEKGLMVALDDDAETITLSDSGGNNLLELQVNQGVVTLKGVTQVVVDAAQIQLVDGASHPVVFGDALLQYLGELQTVYQSHVHVGQMAGPVPVSPAPPSVPLKPPTPDLISTKVLTG
jgi:uncharacterized protein involved in type VI secretion and phage assembly